MTRPLVPDLRLSRMRIHEASLDYKQPHSSISKSEAAPRRGKGTFGPPALPTTYQAVEQLAFRNGPVLQRRVSSLIPRDGPPAIRRNMRPRPLVDCKPTGLAHANVTPASDCESVLLALTHLVARSTYITVYYDIVADTPALAPRPFRLIHTISPIRSAR
jgi:hypothetical protein